MEVDITFHRDAEVMPEIQNGRMETNHTVVQGGQCFRSSKSGTRHHIIEPETIAVEQDAQESDIFIGNVQPEYPIENYYANEKEREFEYAEDQLYWRTCSKCRESWVDNMITLEQLENISKKCKDKLVEVRRLTNLNKHIDLCLILKIILFGFVLFFYRNHL